MELVLNEKEAEAALLAWAEQDWPETFKSVKIETNYSTLRRVSFFTEKEDD